MKEIITKQGGKNFHAFLCVRKTVRHSPVQFPDCSFCVRQLLIHRGNPLTGVTLKNCGKPAAALDPHMHKGFMVSYIYLLHFTVE